jgi:hypothetical protein
LVRLENKARDGAQYDPHDAPPCVTLNFDAGVPPNLIGGITGHSPDEINDILAHYRARTADQAAAALELRMAHDAKKGIGA